MTAATTAEDRFWVADHTLHDRLMRAGGNQRAAAIIDRLRATTALLGPPTTAAGRTLPEICAEHEPIVAAILDRRGADAETAMRRHLEHTGELLTRTLHPPAPGLEPVSPGARDHVPAAGWGTLRPTAP
jgi:DNA-binding GntR family transcriptional regulator